MGLTGIRGVRIIINTSKNHKIQDFGMCEFVFKMVAFTKFVSVAENVMES